MSWFVNTGRWAAFLGSLWARKKPRKAGLYPVRGADGGVTDPRQWVYLDDQGKEHRFRPLAHGEPGWQGDWWGQAVPPVTKED